MGVQGMDMCGLKLVLLACVSNPSCFGPGASECVRYFGATPFFLFTTRSNSHEQCFAHRWGRGHSNPPRLSVFENHACQRRQRTCGSRQCDSETESFGWLNSVD